MIVSLTSSSIEVFFGNFEVFEAVSFVPYPAALFTLAFFLGSLVLFREAAEVVTLLDTSEGCYYCNCFKALEGAEDGLFALTSSIWKTSTF